MILKNRKEIGVKKRIVMLFLVLLSSMSFAQNAIIGKWKTNDVIGYKNKEAYSLVKEKEFNYGRYVTFNLDGTFLCNEIAQCLNDCFVSISGTYTLIDNNRVHMIVGDACFCGLTCSMEKRNKEDIIKDFGVFYIEKERDDKIRLISSKD